MKIVISSTGKDLDSQVDARFGRCPNFIFVETTDMSFEVIENDSSCRSSGAGINAAQLVASKKAIAVLTGDIGPKAEETLSIGKIEIFTGQYGTVREAIEKYKQYKKI